MPPNPPPRSFDIALLTVLDEIKVLDKYMLRLVHSFPLTSLFMGDGPNHPCNTMYSMGLNGVVLRGVAVGKYYMPV